MIGIALGLLSALSYGVLDVCSVLAARWINSMRVLAWTHALSATVLSTSVGISLLIGASTLPTLDPTLLSAAVGMGIANAFGNMALYRAFERGPIALIAPITSAYGLIPLVLSVLFLGEVLSWDQGMACVIIGMGMLALTFQRPEAHHQQKMTGVLWGLGAMICFGVEIFVLARVTDHGILLPLALSRLCSTLVLFLLTRAQRKTEERSSSSSWWHHVLYNDPKNSDKIWLVWKRITDACKNRNGSSTQQNSRQRSSKRS